MKKALLKFLKILRISRKAFIVFNIAFLLSVIVKFGILDTKQESFYIENSSIVRELLASNLINKPLTFMGISRNEINKLFLVFGVFLYLIFLIVFIFLDRFIWFFIGFLSAAVGKIWLNYLLNKESIFSSPFLKVNRELTPQEKIRIFNEINDDFNHVYTQEYFLRELLPLLKNMSSE